MMQRSCLILIVLIGSVVFVSSPAHSQQAAFGFDDIEEVVVNWSPNQHLFVRGDIRVNDDQLSRLETWLDKFGSNWTVVLMDTGSTQAYYSVEGRLMSGMDACEYALGHGLANRTRFGELVNEKTGETNGAIFILYLAERKFNYLSSDAQDRRGFGESKWNGNLDRDAFRAMRNGGRVVDAVMNTVTSINSKVNHSIQREAAARKEKMEREARIAKEKSRQVAELKAMIEQIRGPMVEDVSKKAVTLRGSYPEAADSRLAKPPVDEWKKRLNDLRVSLDTEKVNQATQSVQTIRGEVNEFLDDYAAHDSFDSMLDTAEASLDVLVRDRTGAADQQIAAIRLLIADGRAGHAVADHSFADKIHEANLLINQGSDAIRLENNRREDAREKWEYAKTALLRAAGIAGLLSLITLWLMNVWRRPARRKAMDLFDKRVAVVESEMTEVANVLERSRKLLGTKDEYAAKEFVGLTNQLGESAFKNVGELESLSTEAWRSIESANMLLHPPSPVAQAMNMIVSTRYHQCAHDLNGETYKTQDDNGSPVWMAFGEFVSVLDKKRNATTEGLDTMEVGFNSVEAKANELQNEIDQLAQLDRQLERAARMDRNFNCPALFDAFVPALQKQSDLVKSLMKSDPVRAVAELVPAAQQKAGDGLTIANSILNMRETIFPQLDIASRDLKSLGFETIWVKKRVESLSELANEHFQNGVESSITDHATTFVSATEELGSRAKRTVELAREVNDTVAPSLDDLQSRIKNSRETIAQQLTIDVGKALTEDAYDPDVELAQARNQLGAVRASLNYGGVESAMESLDEVTVESAQATRLIDSTLDSLNKFLADHKFLKSRYDRVFEKLPAHESKIELAESTFAQSAMNIRPSVDVLENDEPLPIPEATESLRDYFQYCHDLLAGSASAIELANVEHHDGMILSAASEMTFANSDLDGADELLERVSYHCDRLHELAKSNVDHVQSLSQRGLELKTEQNDARTQQPTKRMFADLERRVGELKEQLANVSTARDPFADESAYEELIRLADSVSSNIRSDRESHAAAGSVIDAAKAELESARQLAHQATHDQIPDSRTTTALLAEVDSLVGELTQIALQFEQPHEDWTAIHVGGSKVYSRAGLAAGQLRRELTLAQAAISELDRANKKVYQAANWTGSHLVSISRKYGQQQLTQAREGLVAGEYMLVSELSQGAYRIASRAIDAAESEVARKRREERRRREARRRASTSMLSSSSSSSGRSRSRSSSFGSSSSSRSSSTSRSSSSSSRSSYGSSSSGFGSRSGW